MLTFLRPTETIVRPTETILISDETDNNNPSPTGYPEHTHSIQLISCKCIYRNFSIKGTYIFQTCLRELDRERGVLIIFCFQKGGLLERGLKKVACALDAVSEATIAETFMISLQDIKPTVNGLELIKYTCKDWRILFCTNQ